MDELIERLARGATDEWHNSFASWHACFAAKVAVECAKVAEAEQVAIAAKQEDVGYDQDIRDHSYNEGVEDAARAIRERFTAPV